MKGTRDPFDGFVHAAAGQLVDGAGEPLLLRGVGLGNWLLPEGYMWEFEAPGPQSPREIEALIADLVGLELAGQFWRRFRATFITEDDIARIRAEGMNHVRLPINSRVVIDDGGELIESGFALIDRLIEWCRMHQLWVVLDLHGAPGGQTGTNIDDSPHRKPELFTDERYRALTVKLWRALARRYRNETAVAAYDLLNEPLPNEHQQVYADRLRDLYIELTAAIREVDPHHAITYEGTHWATNWSIFTEVWDQNSILQFHKYWSAPDRPSIQPFIDTGRELGLPIYMGEGGENTLDWIHTAFQLFEDCGISWNFWTWKRMESQTSPYSVSAPRGWGAITDYAADKAAKPDHAYAWQTLSELLDAMPLSRCTFRSDVIAALLRRPPLRIPATGFGFRGEDLSYKTKAGVPLRGFRSDDLVSIRHVSGFEPAELDWNRPTGAARSGNHDLVVSLGIGDWVVYDIVIASPSRLELIVGLNPAQVSEAIRPALEIAIDGTALDVHVGADETTVRATSADLPAGEHAVRLTGHAPEVLVRSVEITPV